MIASCDSNDQADPFVLPGDIAAWEQQMITFHAFRAKQAGLVAQGFITENVGDIVDFVCPCCGGSAGITLELLTGYSERDLQHDYDMCITCWATWELTPIYATGEGGQA